MNVVCDGCGQAASDEHIARRLRRLEMATRFRPIHIQILFLGEVPSPRIENYFYSCNPERAARTGLSRALFDELMAGLGIAPASPAGDEPFLSEFQKRGCFFADALECPLEESFADFAPDKPQYGPRALTHRYAPTIVKRVALSYKPKHIVLISTRTRHLIPYLEQAGFKEKLLLHQGLPLHFPHPANPVAQSSFRAGLAEILQHLTVRPAGP